MALKEHLKTIKSELSTEEQFLEKFIRGEKFIRKYKFHILGILLVLLLYFGLNSIFELFKEKNIKESNEIYASLINSPNDRAKLELLKEKNINLYAIFLMNELNKDQANAEILSILKELYQNEELEGNLKNILALNLNEKSLFLKDFGKILEAYKFLEQGKFEEAKVLFSQVKADSTLGQLAKNLKHYQGINQ